MAPEPIEVTLPDPIVDEESENAQETKETGDDLSQTVAAISLVVESSEGALETQIDPGIELPADEAATEETEDPEQEEAELDLTVH